MDKGLINIQTGEIIDYKTAPVKEVSNLLLDLDSHIKRLKKVHDGAKKWIEDNRLEEDKFGDWSVSSANRITLKKPDVEDLPPEVRDQYIEYKRFVEEVEKEFGTQTITQYKTWRRPRL